MSSINYAETIPNNVNLNEDRTLQRALEQWQPNFLGWWGDTGPEGSSNYDVYLRTAVSVDPQGWAQFGYVKMPDYRWGIFLNPGDDNRTIHFGDHKGEKAWHDVPGEHRAEARHDAFARPQQRDRQRAAGLPRDAVDFGVDARPVASGWGIGDKGVRTCNHAALIPDAFLRRKRQDGVTAAQTINLLKKTRDGRNGMTPCRM